MRPTFLAIAALTFVAPCTLAAQPRDTTAKPTVPGKVAPPLAWLAGCWSTTNARRTVQELWLPPAGGTLQGMGRTMRRTAAGTDSVTEFEFLRIVARDGGEWAYLAQPGGQPPTEFTAHSASDSTITFTNLRHDFPQRITYARRGADSLVARVEGTINGATRAIEFPYARSACW